MVGERPAPIEPRANSTTAYEQALPAPAIPQLAGKGQRDRLGQLVAGQRPGHQRQRVSRSISIAGRATATIVASIDTIISAELTIVKMKYRREIRGKDGFYRAEDDLNASSRSLGCDGNGGQRELHPATVIDPTVIGNFLHISAAWTDKSRLQQRRADG